jgi:Flp pilus assembly protein TadD
MEHGDTRSLRLEIERALRGAFDPADVLPRLARLARLAAPKSNDAMFANEKLAELVVERDPWRAALYARRALACRTDDDRPWAILAFSQTLLGNFRSAAAAYRKAIACAPSNPWYAHNLGHLLDVAMGEPARAIVWLKLAHQAKSDNSEIVASYAHALARAGRLDEARRILEDARGRVDSHELDALLRWLEQGAPSRRGRDDGATARTKRATRTTPKRLAHVLARGLSHLPLDPRQRERALALARDALPSPPPKVAANDAEAPKSERTVGGARADETRAEIAGLAAAVAYAIVYIDHVPLSQAEVAAPFRVGVADLRGRFAELRAKLDIIRGDARYATTRR